MNESYKLSIGKIVQCKERESMQTTHEFTNTSAPLFDGQRVYGVDNNRCLHIYSLKDMKWSIVKDK